MTEKQLVVRDESARTHVYQAAYTAGSDAAPAGDRPARARVRRIGGQARAAGARHRTKRHLRSWPKSGSCSTDNAEADDELLRRRRRLDTDPFSLARRGSGAADRRRAAPCATRGRRSSAIVIACGGLLVSLALPVTTAALLLPSDRATADFVRGRSSSADASIPASTPALGGDRGHGRSRRHAERLRGRPTRAAASARTI